MKRSNDSKWDDWDDERGPQAGERSSGVRTRRAAPPFDQEPCTSFDEVYSRHQRFIWLRIRGELRSDPIGAEDVQQRVFIRLDRRIRNDAGVPDPLKPVLLGLIEDEVRNHLRAAKRRRSDGAPDSELPSSKPDPEQLFDHAEGHAERMRHAETIFARMGAEDVELIKLAHLQGAAQQAIADRIGITVGNLRVRLHRARVKFGELYRRDDGSRRKP